MKKILKRLATGFLAFATIVTVLPTTAVHASETQYWTESTERAGYIEKVMNDGSIGATYGVYSDKDCTKQLATLTIDNSGNTDTVEVKAGKVYIKELSAPAGYKVDNTVYSLNVEAGKTATALSITFPAFLMNTRYLGTASINVSKRERSNSRTICRKSSWKLSKNSIPTLLCSCCSTMCVSVSLRWTYSTLSEIY